MAPMERTQKDNVMFNFFKSSKNPKDNFLLVILPKPKPIPFFVTNSNGSKVGSNSNFNCNNLVVQFVCLGGLLTYATSVVDFLKIHVIIKEEESKLPPFKKPKNKL
jgi:hypothetical protein